MKTIVYIFLSLLIGIVESYAQEQADSKATNNDISFSWDGDISFSGAENMYFSTSDSDDTYKVRAKFPERKTKKIRAYLKEELGNKNRNVSGSREQWSVEYNGDTAYEVKVDDGSLRIFIDKELVSSSLLNKFKTINKNIKDYISGKSDKKREEEKLNREEERLEREAQQLIREADRKIREAERLQKEAARLQSEAKNKTDK